jgi:membrane protease YdiL (CAAX protease family)
MHAIGLSSAIYLVYVMVLLPWAAFRSARIFNAPPAVPGQAAARPLPPLTKIYANTTLILVVLFAFAWFTARSFDFAIFAIPTLGFAEILAGVGALIVQLALMGAGMAMRTPDEIRSMPVNRLMPRTAQERAFYSVTAIVAGVAEEAAYRGVLMTILWYALGSGWIAALLSALAFALGHKLQGWKSVAVIFAIALSFQALVWFTHTLVIAMAVHAIYDLIAPTIRRRIWHAPPRDPERSAG